jgi:hypothetical protein
MRFFQKAADGGKNSGVTGYFLVEIKPLFSIVLLRFSEGSREAYHSHAFNALTLWLSGHVREVRFWKELERTTSKDFKAGMWKVTRRDNMHRVIGLKKSWALSFRGSWIDRWQEFKNGKIVTLTHGRKVVA